MRKILPILSSLALLSLLSSLALLPSMAQAVVTVTATQSGADSGSVMAGKTFTVTASGLGDCTSAYLDLASCGVCSVSESQSKSVSGTSVSWTTVTAASKASSQSASVRISGTCTPGSGSASFDVKNPPALSADVSPTTATVTQGSSFSISLNIQNTGETTARFGTVSASPNYFTATGCTPSDISGGQSAAVSCTITASSSATTGAQTMALNIAPSNADSLAKAVSVTVNAAPAGGGNPPGGSSPGGGGGGDSSTTATVSKTWVSLVAGGTGIMPISSASIDFTQLSFQASAALTNAKLTVEKLASRPSSVSADPAGTIYQYVSIAKENMNDTQITATIEFRVNKTWMSKNSIDNSGITLNRYSGTSWTALQTTYVTSDANYTYFSAASPGFSYFAITGTKSAVAAQAPSGKTPGAVCAQVITPAKNTATGECKEFSTPCDVPAGWTKVGSCQQVAARNETTPPVQPSKGKAWTYYAIALIAIFALAYYFLFMRGRGPRVFV